MPQGNGISFWFKGFTYFQVKEDVAVERDIEIMWCCIMKTEGCLPVIKYPKPQVCTLLPFISLSK